MTSDTNTGPVIKPERPRPYRTYDLEKDLRPIIEGKVPVPNLEEMSAEKGLERLAFGGEGGIRGRIRFDAKGDYARATWFLGYEGMGSLGGNGIVVWSATEHEPYRTYGKIGTFAICVHKKVEGPGANHSRGWHPGWCEKCGLDMSVD